MAVVSFRLYCTECGDDAVIRKSEFDETPWRVESPYRLEGVCPVCNPLVNEDNLDGYDDDDVEIDFASLQNIGVVGAENLQSAGLVTKGDIRAATDEKILSVDAIGEAGLESIRRATL